MSAIAYADSNASVADAYSYSNVDTDSIRDAESDTDGYTEGNAKAASDAASSSDASLMG